MGRKNTLHQAILAAGGYAKVAAPLGITRQALYKWVKERVPAERVVEAEAVIGLDREVMRPDLFRRTGTYGGRR